MSVITTKVLRHLTICFASAGFLTACGGGSQDTASAQTQLLANGEPCNAAWVSTTVYNSPTKVSYAGINYTANFYSQNKRPDQNSGATSSAGKPWLIGYTCGGTATTTQAATTTTTAATTTTVAGTTTTTTGGASVTATAGGGWKNNAITTQTGTFTVQFDASVTASPTDAIVGLSNGAQTAFSGFPVMVRFNTSGKIDARNGGAYAAANSISFSANTLYHFRVVVDATNHTYSAYVKAPGGSEQTIGTNYAFRTEQASVSSINNRAAFVNASSGSETVSNFTIGTGTPTTTTTVAGTTTTTATGTTTTRASTTTTSNTTTTTVAQVSIYTQNYNSLATNAVWSSINTAKIKAHPENTQVTSSCGKDGTNCYKVVYRHSDGIHKAPAFTGTNVFWNDPATGKIAWRPSDSTHSNTATDVTQANILVSGPSKSATLTYSLYFEPGFDFAKGGKLPGLAAAGFDSGCTEDGQEKRDTKNWSVRLMWRNNGRVELYSYDQSRPSGSCGIDRIIDAVEGDMKFEPPGQIPPGYENKFRFVAGTWYTITIAVKVNSNNSVVYANNPTTGVREPISADGAETLQIGDANGNVLRTLTYNNVALRDECDGTCPASVPDSPETWVNAVFFSTFFGGNETKRTTCLNTTPPAYPGLTLAMYDTLCASQRISLIYPTATWNPQTPSTARFDNFKVVKGYLGQ